MKKNVLIVTGSRADYGLIESTIQYLSKSKIFVPVILVTGMHTLATYGKTVNNIKGNIVRHVVNISENGSMLQWLNEEIKGIAGFCSENKTDCILVLGDRDEAFAGAIVGGHLGIPVAHIHGGDFTGENTIDHKIRNSITQLSDYHFPATKKSAERIIEMKGKKHVYVVGAPGIDLMKKTKITNKRDFANKYNLTLNKPWITVLLHPVYIKIKLTFEEQILSVVNAVRQINGEKIWIYPNSDTGSDIFIKYIEKENSADIHFIKNIPREDFINLLKYSNVMIGNSSAGIIESTFFNLPVVNIGDRQKGREKSENVIETNYNTSEIVKAIKYSASEKFILKCNNINKIYGKGLTGRKISLILEKLL